MVHGGYFQTIKIILILFPEKLQAELGKQRWLVCMSVQFVSCPPPPLRKAMLPGQSTQRKRHLVTQMRNWGMTFPGPTLVLEGPAKCSLTQAPFTLHNLPLLCSPWGTPWAPDRCLKWVQTELPPLLGGRRGSVCRGRHGTAGVSFWCGKQYCLDNWRSLTHPHLHPRSAMVSAPALFTPVGLTLITVGEEAVTFLGAAWDPVLQVVIFLFFFTY